LEGVSAIGNTDGAKAIGNAVARIYSEGGVLAFWTGNGLSVMKIFPESAIKFFSYESAASAMHLASWSLLYVSYFRNVLLLNMWTTLTIYGRLAV